MYDDNESPYRCPLCLVRPSLCTTDAITGKHTVGCLTCDCGAPVFTEPEVSSTRICTKYIPLIEWDSWVVQYRNEHPNWHQVHVCKGCLKDWKTCGHYDKNCMACPDAVYETEETTGDLMMPITEIKKKCLCCGKEIFYEEQEFCDRCFPIVCREVFNRANDDMTVEEVRERIRRNVEND